MCGRYTLTRHEDAVGDLQAVLGTTIASPASAEWWRPRFNVAPTQPAPVATMTDGVRTLDLMRWGLLPFWATKPGARPPLMINARVETLNNKAWFRDALARRRCLVPADGFFEWRREAKKALPIYFHREARATVAFAGLWAKATTTAGELQLSFTIITCRANELVAPVHDRMPIVLPPRDYAAWLDPALDGAAARSLLDTPPVGDWLGESVSPRVNKAQNDDPSCIQPEHPAQRTLL